VLIPAFNEAKVIAAAVGRVLATAHADIEVIVIDDGSTDGTAAAVLTAFPLEPRIKVLSVPNGGKARALNIGLKQCSGDIVVALDADTQFEPDTIDRLARWFADPQVGAVAGNAKVGNRVNLATRWQALEYVTAQNLERRALAALGAITVVPGAIGAWRRSAITQLGGFPADTLAEDQDLTIAVQRAGMKVIFDSEAVAWTEAPEGFRTLARQRFRWAYGTLQCLWKHKKVLLNPRYGALGLFALPQVLLFQVALSLLSPVVDMLLFWQLIRSGIDYLQHGSQFVPDNLIFTAACFVVFTLVDLLSASVAFAIERGEDWKLLLRLPLQRFGYRQIMYYVVVKSVIKAATGPRVGWGKLDRTGGVSIAE
jgi:cellulose synthase/poly-beta-1,6-N-acetylglucosamine synthase-like glycosyltransferase